MVDNNSSDQTLSAARKWANTANTEVKIHILECHKWGAAATRNYGTSHAKGKYLWFIDADDSIAKDSIKKLLKTANKQNADLIMMGANRSNQQGHISYLSAVNPSKPDYKSRFVRYGMGPWQVLIRRSWWNRHHFHFQEGIIHEDMELMSSLILYTNRFASIDEPLYFYHTTPNSVLHQDQFNPHIFDIFPALEGLYQKFKAAPASPDYLAKHPHATSADEYHAELEWFFIWNLLIDSAKDFAAFPEGRPGFAKSRQTLKKYFPTWRHNRFLRQKPLKLRLRVNLNYLKR